MGLSVYNNVQAENAHRLLANTNTQLSKSMERLSSGLRCCGQAARNLPLGGRAAAVGSEGDRLHRHCVGR